MTAPYEHPEDRSWSERNSRPRSDKPKFDFDKWTESNTFTKFPDYQTFQALQHMTVEDALIGLSSPQFTGTFVTAIYKVADTEMRLHKDECRIKRGLDRYHFKTEQEISQAERLSRVFKQLIQRAVSSD